MCEVAASAGNLGSGLAEFAAGHVDFALSESTFAQAGIPSGRPSTYVPIAAQSISVAYNVRLDGVPVQGLRLSNATTAKIFTGVVTRWDDPAIVADNRDIALPSLPIRPVVRAESSATTRRFTDWLNTVEPELWQAFCPGCGATNTYPSPPGMFAIPGATAVNCGPSHATQSLRTEVVAGELATTRVLAVATRGAGTARLTARLDLWVPTATTAGDYRALLTLTAI
ncbi:substrate-binding domain-containing protein [Actinokineospora globicatena]|uniref:substrate-binding domain-containing protein n=1 Tax=Actinokineospora globicatena TaxID=103729 RepID=UPI0020A3B4DF|nr:substrate-binding domain-containing protein [Actinokineospora globicatena]MCP2306189.1 PBP superfamily domain-containing protein [Actinokineospora globicatena]GLW79933.1 hypothetical protein Aglo01_44140 [Actinokineospora globicatena]GLW86762.1 hypothetical protein Aglo02_44010 [Actinokineospora globicatena]